MQICCLSYFLLLKVCRKKILIVIYLNTQSHIFSRVRWTHLLGFNYEIFFVRWINVFHWASWQNLDTLEAIVRINARLPRSLNEIRDAGIRFMSPLALLPLSLLHRETVQDPLEGSTLEGLAVWQIKELLSGK